LTDYIELHAASAFSFLEGAALPEEYAGAAADYGMPAMALLDRDGVYGAARFHLAAKKAKIQAHIGAEVTSTTGIRYPLLAETREGYQNLCRLLTRMKLRAPKGKGAITEDELASYARGLVCLTGGEYGPLSRAIPDGNSRAALDRLIDIFGRNNVYIELQRQLRPPGRKPSISKP
jgi:error-prone DNA polymerase